MSAKNTPGIVLIRENTTLPAGLALTSEAFLPDWKIVRDIDVFELGRKIEKAHWNFFYFAGEMKTIAFGREQPGALRRAIKQILAKQEGRKCNSLEITNVVKKNLLGIPFLTVTAHSRHIQESLCLTTGKDTATKVPLTTTARIELESTEPPCPADAHTSQHPVQVTSV